MPSDILLLKMPPIPDHIDSELLRLCNQIEINQERLQKHRNFFVNDDLPGEIIAQEYDSEMVPPIPRNIIKTMKQTYGHFFDGGILTVLAAAINNTGKPMITPPHCDKQRRVAVNYLLDTGGDYVQTTMYQQVRKSRDLSDGENIFYKEATVRSKTQIPSRTWHTFDAQRYHSVENITGRRCYVSLVLILNPSFDDFCNSYQHLIV